MRDFRGGVQASAMRGQGVLLFTDVFAGTESPGPHGNPADSRRFGLVEGVQVNSYFDRAYLRARGALGTVTLGHSWLRWGPGVTGGVGLSDGSQAYDFVEFRTRFWMGYTLIDRKPVVDVAQALNMTVGGIVAHQSALKDGELLKIPQFVLK